MQTSLNIFRCIDDYLSKNGLVLKCVVGLCTDCVAAMTGLHSGFSARIKTVASKFASGTMTKYRSWQNWKQMENRVAYTANRSW
jgi:hypothetical protein